ncbi:hypothetical protein [Mycobacterium conspicuum]|uniref:Uncharacterized protein n=1 Tax=Mycobacterium conspicuum TaxID=44010 RepID=A0A1X1THV1_9MYCO|nr:hypothetical protein [Mycobacterium conspicuum]ORV44088.1 hypothetical protein AWC00_08055 [Mycobacterium conspicuum]BBZ39405.1 hypothetical protein MCNS_24680 [Mycobacterium conspicuum]
MRIRCLPTAWQHGITGDEIRAVISFPLLRYGITTAYPDADTYMFVGAMNNEPWIEVAAEDEDGHTWAVFHAMVLTPGVAAEVYEISGDIIDLRADLSPQRPYVGPQYDRDEEI